MPFAFNCCIRASIHIENIFRVFAASCNPCFPRSLPTRPSAVSSRYSKLTDPRKKVTHMENSSEDFAASHIETGPASAANPSSHPTQFRVNAPREYHHATIVTKLAHMLESWLKRIQVQGRISGRAKRGPLILVYMHIHI